VEATGNPPRASKPVEQGFLMSPDQARYLLLALARLFGFFLPTSAKKRVSPFFRRVQRLFHILVGLAFLVLAVAGAAVSFSEWQYYLRSPSVGLVRVILFASFTVLLTIFCLYSFAKARSVQ
jgi:hypothetical protein